MKKIILICMASIIFFGCNRSVPSSSGRVVRPPLDSVTADLVQDVIRDVHLQQPGGTESMPASKEFARIMVLLSQFEKTIQTVSASDKPNWNLLDTEGQNALVVVQQARYSVTMETAYSKAGKRMLETYDKFATEIETVVEIIAGRDLQGLRRKVQAWKAQEAAQKKSRILGSRTSPLMPALPEWGVLANTASLSPGVELYPAPGGFLDDISTPNAYRPKITLKVKQLYGDTDGTALGIVNYVRTKFVPRIGVGIQRSLDRIIDSGTGTSAELSALLYALLQVAEIPARFVVYRSTNYFGYFERGTPTDRVTIQALLPMAGYKGHPDEKHSKEWVLLDPFTPNFVSSAAISITEPAEITAAMLGEFVQHAGPQRYDQFITDVVNQGVTPYPASVSGFSLQLTASPYQYLVNNFHDPGIVDYLVLNRIKDIKEAILFTGNYLPEQLRIPVRISMRNKVGVIWDAQLFLDQVGGERISFTFAPATRMDGIVLMAYGGLDKIPCGMIDLVPSLRVNGLEVARGQVGVPLCVKANITMGSSFNGYAWQTHKQIISGESFVLQAGGELSGSPYRVPYDNDQEVPTVQLLYNTGHMYSRTLLENDQKLGAWFGALTAHPWPDFVETGFSFYVDYVLGLPGRLQYDGLTLDVLSHIGGARDFPGDQNKRIYEQLEGAMSSSLEAEVFEDLLGLPAVSTIRLFQIAVSRGTPARGITQTDLDQGIFPDDIAKAISRELSFGYSVRAIDSLMHVSDWRGYAWQSWDPATGRNGYYISGGLGGGQTLAQAPSWSMLPDDVINVISKPIGNIQPPGFSGGPEKLAGVLIIKEKKDLYSGNATFAVTVRAISTNLLPVSGVTLSVVAPVGGQIGTNPAMTDTSGSLTAPTDQDGEIKLFFRVSRRLDQPPEFHLFGDKKLPVKVNEILVRGPFSKTTTPYNLAKRAVYVRPGIPKNIVVTVRSFPLAFEYPGRDPANSTPGFADLAADQSGPLNVYSYQKLNILRKPLDLVPVVIQVQDEYGNPVPQVPVSLGSISSTGVLSRKNTMETETTPLTYQRFSLSDIAAAGTLETLPGGVMPDLIRYPGIAQSHYFAGSISPTGLCLYADNSGCNAQNVFLTNVAGKIQVQIQVPAFWSLPNGWLNGVSVPQGAIHIFANSEGASGLNRTVMVEGIRNTSQIRLATMAGETGDPIVWIDPYDGQEYLIEGPSPKIVNIAYRGKVQTVHPPLDIDFVRAVNKYSFRSSPRSGESMNGIDVHRPNKQLELYISPTFKTLSDESYTGLYTDNMRMKSGTILKTYLMSASDLSILVPDWLSKRESLALSPDGTYWSLLNKNLLLNESAVWVDKGLATIPMDQNRLPGKYWLVPIVNYGPSDINFGKSLGNTNQLPKFYHDRYLLNGKWDRYVVPGADVYGLLPGVDESSAIIYFVDAKASLVQPQLRDESLLASNSFWVPSKAAESSASVVNTYTASSVNNKIPLTFKLSWNPPEYRPGIVTFEIWEQDDGKLKALGAAGTGTRRVYWDEIESFGRDAAGMTATIPPFTFVFNATKAYWYRFVMQSDMDEKYQIKSVAKRLYVGGQKKRSEKIELSLIRIVDNAATTTVVEYEVDESYQLYLTGDTNSVTDFVIRWQPTTESTADIGSPKQKIMLNLLIDGLPVSDVTWDISLDRAFKMSKNSGSCVMTTVKESPILTAFTKLPQAWAIGQATGPVTTPPKYDPGCDKTNTSKGGKKEASTPYILTINKAFRGGIPIAWVEKLHFTQSVTATIIQEYWDHYPYGQDTKPNDPNKGKRKINCKSSGGANQTTGECTGNNVYPWPMAADIHQGNLSSHYGSVSNTDCDGVCSELIFGNYFNSNANNGLSMIPDPGAFLEDIYTQWRNEYSIADPTNTDAPYLTSGWRNPERNEAVGGVINSEHQWSPAADIKPDKRASDYRIIYTNTAGKKNDAARTWCRLAKAAWEASDKSATTEVIVENNRPGKILAARFNYFWNDANDQVDATPPPVDDPDAYGVSALNTGNSCVDSVRRQMVTCLGTNINTTDNKILMKCSPNHVHTAK